MTSKEVAQWMLDQMGDSHWLHQEAIAQRLFLVGSAVGHQLAGGQPCALG
jgi:hypothetical protein